MSRSFKIIALILGAAAINFWLVVFFTQIICRKEGC